MGPRWLTILHPDRPHSIYYTSDSIQLFLLLLYWVLFDFFSLGEHCSGGCPCVVNSFCVLNFIVFM